ncbi:glycosyltransferase family 2 protein [Hyphomonas sp.]|jgi:cellulose synthase/poly-beta-1,6-N-acetylglucosamine synthase-like glycosyltransferase|uniref:glycosyltransferase family 2 protein n=1 Tax=Hyphomonas sp. TaxID=87 RepID=UPI0039E49217
MEQSSSGLPRTKPRALNYGLARARGAYVVVYDAEDRPDPRQLREAVAAFVRGVGTSRLACVQAPLVGMPEGGGWLSAQWALEYAIQFGRILPALARLGLPIALGGTSNHFNRARLIEAGGWDAWNVTEDADLGLRLARRGARVGMIAPPTLEAPPEQMGVWLAQRSRWLKGLLQTWLVLMRTLAASLREMGLAGFVDPRRGDPVGNRAWPMGPLVPAICARRTYRSVRSGRALWRFHTWPVWRQVSLRRGAGASDP